MIEYSPINLPLFRLGKSYVAAFSPSGRFVATLSRQINIWQVETRRRVLAIKTIKHPAHVCFSPDESYVAVKSTWGEVALFELATGSLRQHFRPRHADEGCAIYFSADGTALIDGSWDGKLYIRPVSTLIPQVYLSLPNCIIIDLDYLPSTHEFVIAVATKDSHPKAAESTPDTIIAWRFPFIAHEYQVVTDLDRTLSHLKLSGSGHHLAVVQAWRHIHLFNWRTRIPLRSVTVDVCKAIAWSPDEQTILTIENHQVGLYDSVSLQRVGGFRLDYASSLSWSPDGRFLVVGSWQDGILATADSLGLAKSR